MASLMWKPAAARSCSLVEKLTRAHPRRVQETPPNVAFSATRSEYDLWFPARK
jgi:hypothetical protein